MGRGGEGGRGEGGKFIGEEHGGGGDLAKKKKNLSVASQLAAA